MRCPACRADNEEKPTCRRCRADLSLLWAVEEQRERCLRAARECLRAGQNDEALTQIRQASALHQGEDAERLAVLALLLKRDFAGALRRHTACGSYRSSKVGS